MPNWANVALGMLGVCCAGWLLVVGWWLRGLKARSRSSPSQAEMLEAARVQAAQSRRLNLALHEENEALTREFVRIAGAGHHIS